MNAELAHALIALIDAKIALAIAEARPGHDRRAGMKELDDDVTYCTAALFEHIDNP